MLPAHMTLKLLLPSGIYAQKTQVSRIVAETREGSFGLMPHRLDCVAALVAGILTYEDDVDGEVFVAIDQGVLVKTGFEVFVSVRRAFGGSDLGRLHDSIQKDFVTLNDDERSVRTAMEKLEAGFLSRVAVLNHD